MQNLEEKLSNAIGQCEAEVHWLNTDGSDVKEILEEVIGKSVIRARRKELLSLLDTKDFGLSRFARSLVYEKLGGGKNRFIPKD